MDITAEDYRLANENLKERIRFMSAELKDKTQHVIDLEKQVFRMQVELFHATAT